MTRIVGVAEAGFLERDAPANGLHDLLVRAVEFAQQGQCLGFQPLRYHRHTVGIGDDDVAGADRYAIDINGHLLALDPEPAVARVHGGAAHEGRKAGFEAAPRIPHRTVDDNARDAHPLRHQRSEISPGAAAQESAGSQYAYVPLL